MISIVQDLFGSYVPLEGEGIAALNWEWISGVFLFGIVLISLFRLLMVLLKR